jgi:hypothetical protein
MEEEAKGWRLEARGERREARGERLSCNDPFETANKREWTRIAKHQIALAVGG